MEGVRLNLPGEGGTEVVIYPDLAFLLNGLTDFLALSATAKLAGLPLRRRRVLAAALLGGAYGVLCLLPPLAAAGGLIPQALTAAALVWIAFGRKNAFLRQMLLFWLISCAMGGILLALNQLASSGEYINILEKLNWKVFLLAGGACYLLLSVIFRGGARHTLAKELTSCRVQHSGRSVALTALLDTGHTLTDAVMGQPVLIAEAAALEELWLPSERQILRELRTRGAAWCLQQLRGEGRFRLLPYRAVGVSSGMLLCFTADKVIVGDRDWGPATVALSPTPVSDGGGYTALWGGSEGRTDHGT